MNSVHLCGRFAMSLLIFMNTLAMVAPQGSILVGSLSMSNTTSVQRMALVVLQIAVKMHDLSLLMLLFDGRLHCVPCNIRGITKVATPFAFNACDAGHLVVRTAEAIE